MPSLSNRYWAYPNSLCVFIADGCEAAYIITRMIDYHTDEFRVSIRGTQYPDVFNKLADAKAFVEVTYALIQ